MTHQTERRKVWWLGLAPGNWITIATILGALVAASVGGIVSYARAMDRIDSNTGAIEKVEIEVPKQISAVEKRLSIKIDSSEGRLRGDMKEIRNGIQQILLKGNHN